MLLILAHLSVRLRFAVGALAPFMFSVAMVIFAFFFIWFCVLLAWPGWGGGALTLRVFNCSTGGVPGLFLCGKRGGLTLWRAGMVVSFSVSRVDRESQTIQSKLVAHLIPPVCTNSHKSGTTWWPAEGMYIWVQPTYSHLSNIISLALYYNRQSGQIYYVDVVPANHDKHIVVGQYRVCDQPNNVYMVSADHYIFIMVGWYWMCDHTNNVYMVPANHDNI